MLTWQQLRRFTQNAPIGGRLCRDLQSTRFFSFIPVSNTSLPKQHKSGRESALRQVRWLLRLCKLPFALFKTTAVIPVTVLVDGINGRAVLQGLEAPRTLLVSEIAGKSHEVSSVLFFHALCNATLATAYCTRPVFCAMQIQCRRTSQAGTARRNGCTPSTRRPRSKSAKSGGAAWA